MLHRRVTLSKVGSIKGTEKPGLQVRKLSPRDKLITL